MTLQHTLNFNKRQIMRELKRYSLQSVLHECIALIDSKKFRANWIFYLIIKWKFTATDAQRDFRGGRVCDSRTVERWSQMIWCSRSNLDSVHHFLRTMIDTQMIWQKNYLQDVFFFPSFIASLDEKDAIRQHILGRYKIPLIEFKLLFFLLYIFRTDHQLSIATAQQVSPALHQLLISVIDDLTTDWQNIAGHGLTVKTTHDDAFITYLANIDLQATTFEGTESPWMEKYPLIAFGQQRIFSLDIFLWQRKLSMYFYEKLSMEVNDFSDAFGNSFENYCKQLVLSYFPVDKVIENLPRSSSNADLIMEDNEHFYIVEIKHKKYDQKIFSIEDSKRLSCQLFNQVVKGYQQVKATARHIDEHRIFKFKRKPINKRRIGFVVTERSYGIGHGEHFTAFSGQEYKIEDSHIRDADIYFIGVQEFELLLLASHDNGLSLGAVVQSCFDQRQNFIERIDVTRKFNLKSQTRAESTKNKCIIEFKRFLKQNSKNL